MAIRSETDVAPYAVRSDDCGGRVHPEPDDPLRNPFELDRHRVVESTAFRRLENKTQVFAPAEHDHFRTRLTHTLEVAQIARCLAGALRANEALAEAIALAHDLGHAPFGHAGEAALDEVMADHGGFNHNAHALRVVAYLEHPFPDFRGLNLTGETRAGLAAHATRYDTPVPTHDATVRVAPRAADAARAAVAPRAAVTPRAAGFSPREPSNEANPARPGADDSTAPTGPSIEAQITSIADRIAYIGHDLEDAIGAEFIGVTELSRLTLWCEAYEAVAQKHRAKPIHAVRRVVLNQMLDRLLLDVIATSAENLSSIQSLRQAKAAQKPLVAMSGSMDRQLGELEDFLRDHVYRHAAVAAMDAQGRGMIRDLFDAYRKNPTALPDRFQSRILDQGLDRVICDYIAGMTDRFCTTEHKRLGGRKG